VEAAEAAGDVVLAGLIRLIGAFWVLGAIFLARRLRKDAQLDSMLAQLNRAAAEFDPEATAARADADEAWADADDRRRRWWMMSQAALLAATGLAMALLSPWAAWLCAALLGGQGAYFIWRERVRRTAPTDTIAEEAAPARETVNAAWFSLVAGCLTWIAFARGSLTGPGA
jgi:Flp pilus assembly protein TadB